MYTKLLHQLSDDRPRLLIFINFNINKLMQDIRSAMREQICGHFRPFQLLLFHDHWNQHRKKGNVSIQSDDFFIDIQPFILSVRL